MKFLGVYSLRSDTILLALSVKQITKRRDCAKVFNYMSSVVGLSTAIVHDRVFPVASARVWNELPRHVTVPTEFSGSRPKTHLFSRPLPDFT